MHHKKALELVEELNKEGINVNTHIFELGYMRPNFVTLEKKGVNYNSGLLLNKEFYERQEPYKKFPVASKPGNRVRRIWKGITFVNHCFKNYKIVEFEHKLQPKPSYIWYQIKGFLLSLFRITEYKLKKMLLGAPFCCHTSGF